jgi:hypothetical protein
VNPTFGPEVKVTISGLNFDAMEPFISSDGNTMFFNSLNSGGNTNLYFASRLNDSTFTFEGLVQGCYDSSANHLDGVASLDSLSNFYWVSLRNYPVSYENLHKGNYNAGSVSNIGRVYGDFNIYSPGWLIMDAAINHTGNELIYCNAYFNNCNFGMPCEARLGIAQQVNDSTFNKLSNTDSIFSNVNDTNYIVYAPQLTHDGLELYFTRILKNTINSEICVSVRANSNDPFGVPVVIHSNVGFVPEAASPTADKQLIYYHQKDSSGIFHIYLIYRSGASTILEDQLSDKPSIYPIPASEYVYVQLKDGSKNVEFVVMDALKNELLRNANESAIDISSLANGIYFLIVHSRERNWVIKIVKQ